MANPATDLSTFISQIAPTLVNQRTQETTNANVAPSAINMSDLAFAQAMEQATSSQDALVANIFKRATLSFAPTLAEEHTAGVYNSTTQAQLQNEALARATGEAADAVLKAQAAGTQTAASIAGNRVNAQRGTSTSQTKNPSLGSKAGTIATSVIAAQLAKKGINKIGDLFPKGSWFGTLNDTAAVEAAGGGSAAVDAAGVAATEGASASADLAAGEVGDILGASSASAAGADILAEGLGADAAVDAAGADATASAITAASTAPEETAAALGLTEAGIGGAVGAGIVGAVGAGIVGSIEGEGGAESFASGGPAGSVLGSTVAGDTEGAVENLATGGLSGVANTAEEATGWIVCTELKKQGRMQSHIYRAGTRAFLQYPKGDRIGYYIWAKPLTKHLQQYPESWLSKVTEFVMNRRAEQLAGERSLAGFFCKHVLFILCWSLAKIMKGIECLRPMKLT